MSKILIRENNTDNKSPNCFSVILQIDNEEFYDIVVKSPFTQKEETELEWSFEEYPDFPFVEEVRFKKAQDSITAYGESLFNQVFSSNPMIAAKYYALRQNTLEDIQIEIIGSPEFHALHWECMKDPNDIPLSLKFPFLRVNTKPVAYQANVKPSSTLNILIISARPSGIRDISLRTITRPIVEMLKNTKIPVKVDIVRPGTYEALTKKLSDAKAGYYHMVHFDVHGCVMTYEDVQELIKSSIKGNEGKWNISNIESSRFGRRVLERFEGHRAFLAFEQSEAIAHTLPLPDLAEAKEIGSLMAQYQIPIVILNACQSAKDLQMGNKNADEEKNVCSRAIETNLVSQLMASGVQLALGMYYSVRVDGAAKMMEELYKSLLNHKPIHEAIRLARYGLYNQTTFEYLQQLPEGAFVSFV